MKSWRGVAKLARGHTSVSMARRDTPVRRKGRFQVWAAICIGLVILAAPVLAKAAPIEICVVIVTTWEAFPAKGHAAESGELYAWKTRWPLKAQLPFPVGEHPLLLDRRRHVLAILTGMATARAAASITALGLDPRFDLSHAYWIVAGTAGVDPAQASVGSAAWARYVVDGDLAQDIDPRDAPPDWPTGLVPYQRTRPYELPAPPAQMADGNIAYSLNRRLVEWAFQKTKAIKLADVDALRDLRAPYSGPGGCPPSVLKGDALMSSRFWYGAHLNRWAADWTRYWTGDQGQFVMSAEEDTGILQALSFLARDHRARLDRVLILRAGSDYTLPPPGMSAAEFLKMEHDTDFPATGATLDSLYNVAAPVVRQLADQWRTTRDHTPERQPTGLPTPDQSCPKMVHDGLKPNTESPRHD